MISTNAPYGSVYLPLDGMDPALVNVRENGSLCIELNPTVGTTHYGIVGTPDELHWLCDKLRAIVTAHESSTTLAGEAAKRVARAGAGIEFVEWADREHEGWDVESPEHIHELYRWWDVNVAGVRS